MIFTAKYKNCRSDNGISISGDKGKKVGYKGESYPKLAPKKDFWNVWYENKDKLDELSNTKYYIEKYYQEVLSKLDPYAVAMDLEGKVLLCYEDNLEFCHRHLVSAWLELLLGIDVPEIKQDVDKKYTCLPKPMYIKDMLEEVIKENTDSREFDDYTEAILSICDMRETAKRIEIKNKENNKSKVKRY